MLTVKVTRKYQITIPKKIREELGIKVGDELIVRTDGSRIILEPLIERKKNSIDEMLSLVKKATQYRRGETC